jgi:adenylate cyclase
MAASMAARRPLDNPPSFRASSLPAFLIEYLPVRALDPESQALFELLHRYRRAAPDERSSLAAETLRRWGVERTVFVGDMAGFTRRVLDEGVVHYLSLIGELREVCAPLIAAGGGDLLKADADNLLGIFASPEQAIETACRLQQQLHELNLGCAGADRVELGVGLACGPVLVMGSEDVWGSAVNLASKLGEDLARAGEILAHDSLLPVLDRMGLSLEERTIEQSRVQLRYFAVRWS